jgi:hypothetical protein
MSRDESDLPERLMRAALNETLKPEYRDPATSADPLCPGARGLSPMDMMMLGVALKVHRANMAETGGRAMRLRRPPPLGPPPSFALKEKKTRRKTPSKKKKATTRKSRAKKDKT